MVLDSTPPPRRRAVRPLLMLVPLIIVSIFTIKSSLLLDPLGISEDLSFHIPQSVFTADKAVISLSKLTMSSATGVVECSEPLVPVYDRVVDGSSYSPRAIPRSLHLSMKSRCMAKDMAFMVQAWKDALPTHSVYFHDDQAVERLIQAEWPEFPLLLTMMKCVKYKGAMKIDVWRILVIYRYGGIYSDIDMFPGPKMTDDMLKQNDTALFLSDAWNRPSQWFFAMEPKHPIAYFTMLEIQKRVFDLENISKPKVVFTTGPDCLKHGFGFATHWQDKNFEKGETLMAMNNKMVRKVNTKDTALFMKRNKLLDEIIQYNGTDGMVNMTRKERMRAENGVMHWTKTVYHGLTDDGQKFHGSCFEYLKKNE
jgi:mannosyltransferase OCH1-like enzyme